MNHAMTSVLVANDDQHNWDLISDEDEKARLKHILNSSPAVIYVTSVERKHNCTFVSENLCEIMGYGPEEVTEDPTFWCGHIHPEDIAAGLYDIIEKRLEEGHGAVEYRFLHRNGMYHWIHDQFRVTNRHETPREIIGAWTDISEAHQPCKSLDCQASRDELTGMFSRREFKECVDRSLQDLPAEGAQHILCHVDLDEFGAINDAYGSIAGDELLRQLGRRLEATLRKQDIVARLGGDEFGILMEHCTLKQAQRALSQLQRAIDEFRYQWQGKYLAIGASMGVVVIDKRCEGSATALSQADAACCAAKTAGRNRVHVYSNGERGMMGRQQRETAWIDRIMRALKADRLYLCAQPIVPVGDPSHAQHFELLIRMRDESGQIIMPGFFLPHAATYGLSGVIDRWVIETALTWLQTTPAVPDKTRYWCINLAQESLGDKDFLGFILDQFDRKQISPETICFEVTESAAAANFRDTLRFIDVLKGYGCRFALDDFGSGVSSFAYLRNLAVDFVKIDGLLVKNMARNDVDFATVKAVNDLAQTIGKQTIAEFVEDEAIAQKLQAIGVDYAQGYGIGMPIPLTAVRIE